MKFAVLLLTVALLTACASVKFQPFEGKDNAVTGQGGTKSIVRGIEFWNYGTPPRKYIILGSVDSESNDERVIKDYVAKEAIKRNADAAIETRSTTSINRNTDNIKMQFLLIKYLD